MKKSTNILGLLALAGIVALGATASADSVFETVTVSPSINPSTLTYDVPQYSGPGTLTGVELTLTANVPDAGAAVLNFTGSPQAVTVASVSGISGSLVDTALGLNASWASTQSLQMNNFMAPTGLSDWSLPFSFNTTSSGPIVVPTTGFVGGGNNDLSITVAYNPATYGGGPGDSGQLFYGGYESVGGTLEVEYDYAVVPEPSTISLLATGLLGALIIRRRKV